MNLLKMVILLFLFLYSSLLSHNSNSPSSTDSNKVIIIIIDGARYSETYGDSIHRFIPKMWDLSKEGSIADNFHNDSLTYTSRAIPALWSGTWTEVRDTTYNGLSTNYSVKPSIFEYYRKQKSRNAEDAIYVLKYIKSLWLPSFDSEYGHNYWPMFHSVGNSDSDVADEAISVMNEYHPHFLWIYFADVDHAGHSGDWNNYTNAIKIADSLVSLVWNKAQSDSFYKNSTTLFVTNDHGRHDDAHGGFKGHGDGCEGCRHIEFLALGPTVKKDFVSEVSRRTPDLVATASDLLGIFPSKSTGEVMSELFVTTDLKDEKSQILNYSLEQNYPNPFNPSTTIRYSIPAVISNPNGVSGEKSSEISPYGRNDNSRVNLIVYDILGRKVATLVNRKQAPGNYSVQFDASNLTSGLYFYIFKTDNFVDVKKMMLIK